MSLCLKDEIRRPSFLVVLCLLCVILTIRVRYGLDLTDEMQYYGQITGLVDSGQLFSHDLFVQQIVYLLFYPFFKLHQLLLGREGLVLFGRTLVAAMSLGVYGYAYWGLRRLSCSARVASITAFSLTFAIPYHGLFALNYNTVSQAIWVIFAIRALDWRRLNASVTVLLPVAMAFSHQTSALVMGGLILSRSVFEGAYRQAFKELLILLTGAVGLVGVILGLSSTSLLRESLTFSGGFGVGTAFGDSETSQLTLVCFVAGVVFIPSLLSALQRSSWDRRLRLNRGTPLFFQLMCLVCLLGVFAGVGAWSYSLYVFAALAGLFLTLYLQLVLSERRLDVSPRDVRAFVLFIVVYSSTLGITSGNGLGQGVGALMVGLPLLVALVSGRWRGARSVVSPLLLLALFGGLWSRFPYKSDFWWRLSSPVEHIPEFRYLYAQPDRVQLLQTFVDQRRVDLKGEKLLIIGGYPGLYFALSAEPTTCMFFLHSLPYGTSERVFFNCMAEHRPDRVLVVESTHSRIIPGGDLYRRFQPYLLSAGFQCVEDGLLLQPDASDELKDLSIYSCTSSK